MNEPIPNSLRLGLSLLLAKYEPDSSLADILPHYGKMLKLGVLVSAYA